MLDSINASISLNSDLLKINYLQAYKAKQTVSAAVSTRLSKNAAGQYSISGPVNGTLSARQIELGLLQPFLPIQDSVQGSLTADLELNGTISSPHFDGRFTIENNRDILYGHAPPIRIPLIVGRLDDTVLTITADSAEVMNNYFFVLATLAMAQNRGINSDIKISFLDSSLIAITGYASSQKLDLNAHLAVQNVGVARSFLSLLDSLSGSLNVDLNITGSPQAPQANGKLLLHDIAFRPKALKNTFSGTTANISFTQNDVRIDTLLTQVGNGRISLQGTASYRADTIQGADLNLAVDSVKLDMPDVLTLQIMRGNVTYKGQNNNYLLDGNIFLGPSRLTYNFDFASLLPWTKSVRQLKPQAPSILQNTQMNVRIHGGDSLKVENNIANLNLGAALTLIGTPVRPNFTGQISIDVGYLIYLDRKFQVSQGTIFSENRNVFNPDINLAAQTTVTTYQGLQSLVYEINLNVTGKLDSLQIGLTSDPPLSKPDIISLLTLGGTMGQLTGNAPGTGGGGAGGILVERAGTLSSQLVTGLFSGGVQSSLGLKSISLQGNLFNPSGPAGVQLSATKMISPKVAVTYSTNVGQISDNSVLLDYLLSKHFSLQGQTDQAGNSSFNIKYNLLFK